MDGERDPEEVAELYEKSMESEFAYGQQAQNYNEINDSFKFKTHLITVDPSTDQLINKEIVLANLSNQDKKKCMDYLTLASDLIMLGLDGKHFIRDVNIIAGVSRGHRGFQQDKLNEQREIRLARLENDRNKKRGFFKN